MAFSGVCGIWAFKGGDFVGTNFPGDAGGLTAAVNYCGSNGVIQLYPGSGSLSIPSLQPGVKIIRIDDGKTDEFAQGGKLYPTVNARNYANIQAAHDALPSSGGVLYIPAGLYTPTSVPAYTGLVVSKSNVHIKGDAQHAATELRMEGASFKDTHNIDVTAASNVTISDLLILGSNNPATSDELGMGIRCHVDGFGRLRIRNVRITQTGSYSISIRPTTPGQHMGYFHFEDVTCDFARRGGSLRIGGSSLPVNSCYFDGCNFNGPPTGTYGAGGLSRGVLHIQDSYSLHFNACRFEDTSCGTAVSLTGLSYNVYWTACHFETNQVDGDLGGHWITAASGVDLNHITFKTCTFFRLGAPNRGLMLLKTASDTNLWAFVFEDCKMRFDKTLDNALDDFDLGAGGRGVTMVRCSRVRAGLAEQPFTVAGAGFRFVEFIEKPRGVWGAAFATPYIPDAKAAELIEIPLAGNITIGVPVLPQLGLRLTFRFLQDGVGGRTVTWNAIFKTNWANGAMTPNTRSTITFYYDLTNWMQIGGQCPYV